MSRFLVDTNVIIDIVSRDPEWFSWSSTALQQCADEGPLAINPIIYAELAVGFDKIEALDSILVPRFWQRLELPWPAAFLAGRAFGEYRRRGGAKRSPLPDFYIGAHAAYANLVLVTRDSTRYRNYFPGVEIVAP